MRRFVLVCSLVFAAVGSCSLPNFSPPKLGEAPPPIQSAWMHLPTTAPS